MVKKNLRLVCVFFYQSVVCFVWFQKQITFLTSVPLRMTSQLVSASAERDDDCCDYVMQQCQGTSSVAFYIRLPKPGTYKFQVCWRFFFIFCKMANILTTLVLIDRFTNFPRAWCFHSLFDFKRCEFLPRWYIFQVYALPLSDLSDNLPNVYNCLIDYSGPTTGGPPALFTPFPKQFGQWRDGCFLYEPLDGHIRQLSSGGRPTSLSFVHFKVQFYLSYDISYGGIILWITCELPSSIFPV